MGDGCHSQVACRAAAAVVVNNESYDAGFVENNPGVRVDHCHNVQHATQGLAAHLMCATGNMAE